jgi:hypothetical protein
LRLQIKTQNASVRKISKSAGRLGQQQADALANPSGQAEMLQNGTGLAIEEF